MNNTTITVLVGLLFFLLNRNTTAAAGSQPITTPAKPAGSGVSVGSAAGTAANAAVSSLFGAPAITAGLTNALNTTNEASYGLTTTQTIDQSYIPLLPTDSAPVYSNVYDPTTLDSSGLTPTDLTIGADDPSSDTIDG